MNIGDIVWCLILLSFSGFVSNKIGRSLGLRYQLSLALFSWHTVFCVIYWIYALYVGADANRYYNAALQGAFDWRPGTSFVTSFTALFASGLGMNQLSTFLVFNMFGVSGLLLLAHVILTIWPVRLGWRRYVPYIILFMPGLSFWSSAIGKDAPAFLAVCLAAYAFLDVGARKTHLALAVLLMFAFRPHVAMFMLLAAGFALLTGRQIKLWARILIISIVLTATVFALPFVIDYVKLGDEASVEEVGDLMERRQGYNMAGGSSVDIASMPLPLKMFTYLLRPLFFDATGLFSVAVSFENLFLLTVFMTYFGRGFFYILRDSSGTVRYNLLFFVIGLFVFSMTTANLGVAIRQKTMILPSLFVLMAFAANHLLAEGSACPPDEPT